MIADIFSWLIGNAGNLIQSAVIWCINQVILSIGELISAVISLLPAMPTLPTMPTTFNTWIGYGSYFFPLSFVLTFGIVLLGLWVSWMVIAIPLRWAKAIRGAQ